MRWRKYRYKKWDELTTEEKLDKLRYETTHPTIFVLFFVFVGIMMFYILSVLVLQNSYYINDMLNQTGMNITEQAKLRVDSMTESAGETILALFRAALATVILGIIAVVWHNRKWKKFRESIRVKIDDERGERDGHNNQTVQQ